MDIMDGEVNKINNRHKNIREFKIFKMKYPFLKDKNLYSESNHLTKEERQKRLSLIIEKHKLILDKIKKDISQEAVYHQVVIRIQIIKQGKKLINE